MTPSIPLSAPDQQLSQDPHHSIQPYSTYDVSLSKDGYDIEERHSIQIFDQVSSTLDVELQPVTEGSRQRNVRMVSAHRLYSDGDDFYA